LTYTTTSLASATVDPPIGTPDTSASNFLRIPGITDPRFQKMFLYYTFTANKKFDTFTGVSATIPCLTNPPAISFRIGYLNDPSTGHTIVGGNFSTSIVGLGAPDTALTAPHAILRLYYN